MAGAVWGHLSTPFGLPGAPPLEDGWMHADAVQRLAPDAEAFFQQADPYAESAEPAWAPDYAPRPPVEGPGGSPGT